MRGKVARGKVARGNVAVRYCRRGSVAEPFETFNIHYSILSLSSQITIQ